MKRKPRWEIRPNVAGEFYVRLVAANGLILFYSETYSSRSKARRAVSTMRKTASIAEIVEFKE